MPQVQDLYNDIIQRWENAFDDISLLPSFKQKVKQTKFASTYRFDIGNYTHKNFPAGGRLLDTRPEDGLDYYEYGLDEKGRPVHVAFQHTWNKVHWEGFYRYSENLVEYIEFCLDSKLPSSIKALRFENKEKISFQSFILNGGGSAPILQSPGDRPVIVEQIRNSETYKIINVESFIYENTRITKAECRSTFPGAGTYDYKKLYDYDNKGRLEEIKRVFAHGEEQLLYVRVNKKTNINSLSDQLAALMAAAIIDTLIEKKSDQPIALLELSYRRYSDWIPYLVSRSLQQKLTITKDFTGDEAGDYLFRSGYESLLNINDKSFRKPFQQFLQLADNEEDSEKITTMLRKTAFLLTTSKLDNKLQVSEDFVAYPIDWELEGSEFHSILKECGLHEEIIKEWQAKQWI